MTLLVGSIFHMTRKIVSEMTYNVSMGTLNPTIPYRTCGWTNEHRRYFPSAVDKNHENQVQLSGHTKSHQEPSGRVQCHVTCLGLHFWCFINVVSWHTHNTRSRRIIYAHGTASHMYIWRRCHNRANCRV